MDKTKSHSPKKSTHFTFASAPSVSPAYSVPWYKHAYFYTFCSGMLGVAKLHSTFSKNNETMK
jgi:hypothetical protein